MKPTEEGKRRWPPDGWFEFGGDREPCTCSSECEPRCAGECGCGACNLHFAEFADVAGFTELDEAAERRALELYRAPTA